MLAKPLLNKCLPAVGAAAVLVLALDAVTLAADPAPIASLTRPAKRLTAPEPINPPDSKQHTIALDPSWRIEGVTLSPDGQSAFLVVRQSQPDDTTPETAPLAPQDVRLSIREIDADTGQLVALYKVPEPFAFKRPVEVNMPAPFGAGRQAPPINHRNPAQITISRSAISRLAVSPDGHSLVAVIDPPHTRLHQAHGLDARHIDSTFFFRWDTLAQTLTHQQTVENARPDWHFLGHAGVMLLQIYEPKRWSIETWDASDLARTALVSLPTTIHIELDASTTNLSKVNLNDLMKLPPPPVPVPDCAELDDAAVQVTTLLIIPPSPAMTMTKPRITYLLRRFDTASGTPTGHDRRLLTDGSINPVMLRGQHLLLREQPLNRPNAPATFHVWDTQQHKHLAAIKSSSRDARLTDDGSSLQLGNQRLDMANFKWRPAWPHTIYSPDTASTPDGQRKIVVSHAAPTVPPTPATLTISDIQ